MGYGHRLGRLGTAVALGGAFACAGPSAAAQTRELRWNPALDGTVTGVGAAAWITSEILKSALAPSSCRWCAVDEVDGAARSALVWQDRAAADTASSAIAFGLAPLSAALTLGLAADHDGAPARRFGTDALLVGEATALALDLDELTKFLVARERPFVHALPAAEKAHTSHPDENDLSFFSGHTTETSVLAAAAGTVATMRGYRWAPVTWIVGGALALATGYLRIAADKHWLTDVGVGMVIGAAAGVLVPYLFHRPDSAAATEAGPVRASGPAATAFSFAW